MEKATVASRRPCSCIGHFFPNVNHSVPCCDKPHITQEEYDSALELKHQLLDGFAKEMDIDRQLLDDSSEAWLKANPSIIRGEN